VHETRSQAHAASGEGRMMTRKQKAESKAHEGEQSPKKVKNENDQDGRKNGKTDTEKEYGEFCKAIREHLSVAQMREILQMNGQDPSGTPGTVINLLFFGPLDKCPLCNGSLDFDRIRYYCTGFYSEWSSCTFKTKNPTRKEEPIKLSDSVLKTPVADLLKKYQDPSNRPRQGAPTKPLSGIMIALSSRLSRSHQYWKREIEKHGGMVSNSVKGIPVVREEWLVDSIEKHEPQPLEAYDVASDLVVAGKGIPLDKQDPSEEGLETLSAELKLYGKRGVYKDTKLQEQGGQILEKDGIVYNCAFVHCDIGRSINEYCIMQLITVPDSNLHMYFKKAKIGDDRNAEERLEEWENVDNAIKEFIRLFEEITGNEFEPWEREKKFEKKRLSFFPVDMMGLDSPDTPIGMLSSIHLKRSEETLLDFVEAVKSAGETGRKAEAVWSDFSQRLFNLMPSSRPFILSNYHELADHVRQHCDVIFNIQHWNSLMGGAAAFETVRDINVASHLIGDMSGSTIDDPLSDRYKKLGCSISALDQDSDDYKMIVKYLEKTYEPVRVGDIDYQVSVENIYAVESSASPSLDELKKLPNKVLLWCGTRSSNLLRHLQKGFLPSVCSLPVPGYMFGKAIVCSDAAAEAARYGFTAVDRPEGCLVLAVASLGDKIMEVKSAPEDTNSLEEKKVGVKGLGRKKTDESEHFVWKDDIKVPCGRLVPSGHKDSPLEYNEYAVYDPKQTSIRFLVQVKYEEQGVVMDTAEP
ncbi:Poly [ADP-ribose] polymerase 3, partial [Turnera subulata]